MKLNIDLGDPRIVGIKTKLTKIEEEIKGLSILSVVKKRKLNNTRKTVMQELRDTVNHVQE